MKKRGRPLLSREGKVQIRFHVPQALARQWKSLLASRGQGLDVGGEAALQRELEATKGKE